MYRAFERAILDVVFEPLCAYDITRKGTRPIPSREFETSIEHHFPKSLGHSFHAFDFGTPVPEHFRHVFPYVGARSDEHTSELQSLMRNSYAVFCLQKNN